MSRFIWVVVPLVLAATSCTPGGYLYIPRDTDVRGWDFSKYASEGFLFTPHTYQGEYEGVGLLEVVMFPAQQQVRVDRPYGRYAWEWREESISEALLDKVHQQAKSMGADAVVDLHFTSTDPVYHQRAQESKESTRTVTIGSRPVTGVKATGFAIKRIARK